MEEEEEVESLYYYYFLTRKCSVSTKKLFANLSNIKQLFLFLFLLLLNLKYVLKHFGNAKH